ncbi:alpha/beta hydrolase [Mucilaginibacter hurinus]|uniref:Alpha/beta hydrolase n=1 Tax=Mucilaginibacter hurinus TaxID=2201324 RepID=A0A367GTK2_9SPHI|nr:alpha/beta hydrolase [Mucilaginibacter hurinus]RCH56033.1 alpha/beta hydrolase [Mucilaginibacter hurinus]
MIRLVLLIIIFLISLLNFFDAPTNKLWLLAVLVNCYPVIFAVVTALITSGAFIKQRFKWAGNILGIITIAIFLSPVLRAYDIAKTTRAEMVTALGETAVFPVENRPFMFSKLFKVNNVKINPETLTYTTYPGFELKLDYYASELSGSRPCVVVVHGGSWSSGDSKQLPELNSYLAHVGYNVAAINYRLAPVYQNPAPVQDVKAAINYLNKNAVKLNIDTGKFVLLGRSAGAQVALLAAYTLNKPAIKGVVDFYGPADMVWGYSLPANPWVMDSRGVMAKYLGGTFEKVPQNYTASSPIEFVTPQAPPTLIIHGKKDVLVAYGHSERLSAKLRQNGVKHYWLKIPWATHGFDFNLNSPGGQLSTYATEAFINTVTK